MPSPKAKVTRAQKRAWDDLNAAFAAKREELLSVDALLSSERAQLVKVVNRLTALRSAS